jgi:hypothetical protein
MEGLLKMLANLGLTPKVVVIVALAGVFSAIFLAWITGIGVPSQGLLAGCVLICALLLGIPLALIEARSRQKKK